MTTIHAHLRQHGPCTPDVLCQAADLTRTQVNNELHRLAAHGLVERVGRTGDGYVWRALATEADRVQDARDHLATLDEPATLADIAHALRLPRPVTLRVLRALEEMGEAVDLGDCWA